MTSTELEKLCMNFKGVTQDIKWGNDLCYSVGSKMFCVTSLKGMESVSFKTTPEGFAELTERDGIIPAPYTARYHWVLVENSKALHPKEWKQRILESYKLVFDRLPEKLKKPIRG